MNQKQLAIGFATVGLLALTALVIALLAIAGLGRDDGEDEGSEVLNRGAASFDPSFFSPEITNPYFPLASVSRTVLEGEQVVDGRRVRIREETLRGNQHVNISGVLTTYIEVLAYTDGVLVERTKDYFAQGQDGWVYYFGEDVDEYEDGRVLHGGAWKVGWNESEPQKFVPPYPAQTGSKFAQESVPGVAEDLEEVVAVGETAETPAGTFKDAMHYKEYNPLDKSTGEKWMAPGTGIVKETFENGWLLLVEVERG